MEIRLADDLDFAWRDNLQHDKFGSRRVCFCTYCAADWNDRIRNQPMHARDSTESEYLDADERSPVCFPRLW